LAAADAAPESPEIADGLAEPNLPSLPRHLQYIERGAVSTRGFHDGRPVQCHGQCAALGYQGWRARLEPSPPTAHRRVRHVQMLGNGSYTDARHHLQRDPTSDDCHVVKPSHQHEVR
jgi:hypothetical protein